MKHIVFIPHPEGSETCYHTRRVIDFLQDYPNDVREEVPESPEAEKLWLEACNRGKFGNRQIAGYPYLFILNHKGQVIWACAEPRYEQLEEVVTVMERQAMLDVVLVLSESDC